jgi:hypothetical protein
VSALLLQLKLLLAAPRVRLVLVLRLSQHEILQSRQGACGRASPSRSALGPALRPRLRLQPVQQAAAS